jgi:hypothetical protein
VREHDPFLPDDVRALLREPVDLGAAARGRVMQRVRAAAALGGVIPRPNGIARPAVLGALLAASFVASVLTAGARGDGGIGRSTLADTIAVHLAAVAVVGARSLDPHRLVAVADVTRDLAPKRPLPARRN